MLASWASCHIFITVCGHQTCFRVCTLSAASDCVAAFFLIIKKQGMNEWMRQFAVTTCGNQQLRAVCQKLTTKEKIRKNKELTHYNSDIEWHAFSKKHMYSPPEYWKKLFVRASFTFLVADTQLCKKLCLSVGLYVCVSVCWAICWSVMIKSKS